MAPKLTPAQREDAITTIIARHPSVARGELEARSDVYLAARLDLIWRDTEAAAYERSVRNLNTSRRGDR